MTSLDYISQNPLCFEDNWAVVERLYLKTKLDFSASRFWFNCRIRKMSISKYWTTFPSIPWDFIIFSPGEAVCYSTLHVDPPASGKSPSQLLWIVCPVDHISQDASPCSAVCFVDYSDYLIVYFYPSWTPWHPVTQLHWWHHWTSVPRMHHSEWLRTPVTGGGNSPEHVCAC